MTHTQGEWKVVESNLEYQSEIYSGDVRIAEVKSFSKDRFFNDATIEERVQNAKLIASAPELLEQLMKLTKRLEDNWELITSGTQNGILTSLIEDGKKAIDKATK